MIVNSGKAYSSPSCTVIIVTHNSHLYLDRCLLCLKQQTVAPSQIILVDSGSDSIEYLQAYQNDPTVCFYASKRNIGFCLGNNSGFSLVHNQIKYILFLNPDAFLVPSFIEQAISYMEESSHANVAALSGFLLGFDLCQNDVNGRFDSCGVFRKWYGRWYDRGQGERFRSDLYDKEESVPALCGALMFCRREALETVLLRPNEVFDNSFYMYKEDIDLSLRLRKKGWDLKFLPQLSGYHCRGWQRDRRQVPRHLRLLSARNEMKLCARNRSFCLVYSCLKYLLVKFFNV